METAGDEGRGFFYKGKTLLSNVDPQGKAKRIAYAAPVVDRTLYFCPSPLFGYGIEPLLFRLADMPNSVVLCIEADPVLFALSQKYFESIINDTASYNGSSDTSVSRKLRLTNCCDGKSLCALLLREWGPRYFRRVELIYFNGGWQLFRELYQKLYETLQNEIALDWGNAITLMRLGRQFIKNTIRNLSMLQNNFPLAQFSFANDPVLVLGAGPSLNEAVYALFEYFGDSVCLPEKRTFRIICVDTCLRALNEWGIKPDIAVILESQHWNLKDFIGLAGWDIPALIDLSALPQSARTLSAGAAASTRAFFFTPWTNLKLFGRLEKTGFLPQKMPPLGSVGLSAVALALQLTHGSIVAAGLDFSFTQDAFHARSTPGHLEILRRHNRFSGLLNEKAYEKAVIRTVANNGSLVYTNPLLQHYRNLFEREFAACSRVYAFSGSGLPLGVKSLTAQAACGKLSSGRKFSFSLVNNAISKGPINSEKLLNFIQSEQERLLLLRKILCGNAPADRETLSSLIDDCNYLWAHFPDYAATNKHPFSGSLKAGSPVEISFLKRIRAEIDLFLRLWDLGKHP
ncbi:MAG: DUF115 domain-containing protein [Treponema sp.]|nr:DUF115 domain-containing protein [Treponema sp.]